MSMAKRQDPVYVRELQEMLRVISREDPALPVINPDGMYGRETAEAVRIFQSRRGLSPTGTVDAETWDAIVREAAAVTEELSGGAPISPFPSASYVTKSGERSPIVYIIQAMLTEICPAYDGVPTEHITGVYDEETEKCVKLFQKYNRLEQTGQVDKKTWNALAKSFNVFAFNNNYI